MSLLATGYDACSTASNHSLDQGFEGLARTLRTLDRAGLPHDGTARSRREQREPLLLDAEGVRVAVLSYTYGTNGLPVPAQQPCSVPLIDPDAIVRDAAVARRAGADVVARRPEGWWVERDNPREGVDSWSVRAVPADRVVASVPCRLWPRPSMLRRRPAGTGPGRLT